MSGIKTLLLDLSGVLYVGDAPVPGALEAMQRLRASKLVLRFVTNTTRSTRAAIHAKLTGMGFTAEENEIVTAPGAVHRHLAERALRPYLLIHPGLRDEFADCDVNNPNAVVLGDAGEAFDYAHLNHAFRLLLQGAPLIAMGDNRYFMEPDGLSLDIGPFVRALEYAADIQALVLGKPAPAFFHAALEGTGCRPEEALMIGDDALSDVGGALKAGLQALLVKTGKYRAGDERRIGAPGARLADDVAQAVEWVLGAV